MSIAYCRQCHSALAPSETEHGVCGACAPWTVRTPLDAASERRELLRQRGYSFAVGGWLVFGFLLGATLGCLFQIARYGKLDFRDGKEFFVVAVIPTLTGVILATLLAVFVGKRSAIVVRVGVWLYYSYTLIGLAIAAALIVGNLYQIVAGD